MWSFFYEKLGEETKKLSGKQLQFIYTQNYDMLYVDRYRYIGAMGGCV
jgi:hypothetical protein